MSDELLPCPFCGGEPELDWINEAGEVLTAWVSCKCGCEHHERLTKEVAVKKWNSRHLPNDAQTPLNREQIAQIIYDAFPFGPRHGQAQKPAWSPGGNSLMQDEARCAADRILLSRFPCVAAGARDITISLEVARLINGAFLPLNPRTLRTALPETIEAVEKFKAAIASALPSADRWTEQDLSEAKTEAKALGDHFQTWPGGCHDPDSCARHKACMYIQCRHINRSIVGEIDAAYETLPIGG